MKIINRIPTASQTIDKEVDKLFNSKLSVFLGYAFPLLCGLGWILILFAIFSS